MHSECLDCSSRLSCDATNRCMGLQKVLKERGIDSMLEDARKTNGSETDAEFLKKS